MTYRWWCWPWSLSEVVLPRVLHYKFLLFLSKLTLDVKPDPSLHSSGMFCLLFILKTLQTFRKVNKNSVMNSHISSSSFSPRASSIHALSVSLTSSTNLVLILFVLLLFWLNRFGVSCRQLCPKYFHMYIQRIRSSFTATLQWSIPGNFT